MGQEIVLKYSSVLRQINGRVLLGIKAYTVLAAPFQNQIQQRQREPKDKTGAGTNLHRKQVGDH